MEILDKLQKWICKAAGPSLADSLQPLAFRPNVASEVFSKGIAMKDVHLDELLTRCSTFLFSWYVYALFIILTCYKDVYVNSFFPFIARLWNYLPKECFPLNYDLNGFNSRNNRYL